MSNKFISYQNYKSQNVLNETFESFEELKILAQQILGSYSSEISRTNRFYDLEYFIASIHHYKVINKFIKSGIGVMYIKTAAKLAGGSYVPQYQYEDVFGEGDLINYVKKYKVGVILIRYGNLQRGTIIHELQHAYDDFRAKGKFTHTKLGNKYMDQASKFTHIHKDKFPTADEKLKKLYHRTPHELSAYFTTTIDDLEFFDHYDNLRTLKALYYEFKEQFWGYDQLTPRDKKILARKFTQYYYKIKEKRENSGE